ncbi:hypothetical protein [Streptomyces sp. KLOTTS4A1]|uniref:hypothetical protein n=1 Tax=Streptomyces sp. KLOTTS4A1 TaxID=3390996 RepID=UPI0039F5828A
MHHLRPAPRDRLTPDAPLELLPMNPSHDRTVARRDIRTPWGWTRWHAVPGRRDVIQLVQIGVTPPNPPRRTRIARRWLTRPPATLLTLDPDTPHRTLTFSISTVFAAACSLFLVGKLLIDGLLPLTAAMPLTLVAPLLTEFLPGQIDRWARRHTVVIDDHGAVRDFAPYLDLQMDLDAAAAESGLAECRTAARLGRELLWDLAIAAHENLDTASTASAQQLEELTCASVQACAAVMDLEARSHTAPAHGDNERPIEPSPDLRPLVDDVQRDLQVAIEAHQHAADILDSLDTQHTERLEIEAPSDALRGPSRREAPDDRK